MPFPSGPENDARVFGAQSEEPVFAGTSGRFGTPKNELGRILYVETRNALPGRPFRIRRSQDLATNDNAVDMPTYLLRDQDAAFTGGLRLG